MVKRLISISIASFSLIAPTAVAAGTPSTTGKSNIIDVTVTGKGFEPNSIEVKPGDTVELRVTRKTDKTCAKEISVPDLKIKKELPLNTPVVVSLGKLEKGEIKFGCGMGQMLNGIVITR